MPESPSRNYHTIGEVLNVLKPEFPDISISKLRFLEAQGLVEPERTPSGYRKFSSHDIDRLRFILREQRDRFLPLKVIKTRLESWERGEIEAETPASTGTGVGAHRDPSGLDLTPSGVQMDRKELAAASGLSADRIVELVRYRLIEPSEAGGETVFDECALVVAKIARGFVKYGVEGRHLRMFRQAADRESALFEQIVAPMIAQRTPQSRREAISALSDLATLARKLHQALLAQNLRDQNK